MDCRRTSLSLIAFSVGTFMYASWAMGSPATQAVDKRNRSQAFVVGMSDDLVQQAGTITNLLRGVMAQVPGIDVLDLSNSLKAPVPEKVVKLRDLAREQLKAARASLRDMDHAKAVKSAAKARQAFEQMGGHLEPLERYKETLLIIAVASAMQGDIQPAQKAFLDLLLLDPHLKLPKGNYESFVIDLFEQVKKGLSGQPLGSLSIKTDPTGANLYLDGKLKDVTPVSLDGVVAGSHLVMVKLPGYINWGKVVKVQAGNHEVIDLKLTPGQAGSGFVRISSRACKAVADSNLRGEVLRLGETVGLDWAVLGQLKHDAYDAKLRLYMFDFALAQVVYEDELVTDPTYGFDEDVKHFGAAFVRRGLKALKRFREMGDPLGSHSGTEDWNRDASAGKKAHQDTKAADEDRRVHRNAEEGDPLEDKDGTEDW